jgi:uncharacterized protein (DUF1499 family)
VIAITSLLRSGLAVIRQPFFLDGRRPFRAPRRLDGFSHGQNHATLMAMSQRLDFASLKPPPKPNWFLAAPEGLCRNAKPTEPAPVFAASKEEIWRKLMAWIGAEPRMTVHDQDKAGFYLDATQRSLLFRFPDRITVQLLDAAAPGTSTLAIYSRSKYGHSDLGVNAKRVKRLFAALAAKG